MPFAALASIPYRRPPLTSTRVLVPVRTVSSTSSSTSSQHQHPQQQQTPLPTTVLPSKSLCGRRAFLFALARLRRFRTRCKLAHP
jgi:hypothetical protein